MTKKTSRLTELGLDRIDIENKVIAQNVKRWAEYFGMNAQVKGADDGDAINNKIPIACVETSVIYDLIYALHDFVVENDLSISAELVKVMFCIKHDIPYCSLTRADMELLNQGIEASVLAHKEQKEGQ